MRQNLASTIAIWVITLVTAGFSTNSHALIVSIDEFTILRNDALFFTDSFTDGNPPPSTPTPTFADGTAASYLIQGTFPSGSEAGGSLQLNTAIGQPSFNAIGQERLTVGATAATDRSTNFALGLKSDDTLSVTGIFSLTTPPGPLFSGYGLQLQDGPVGGSNHQVLQIFVNFNVATGQPRISFILQDFDADSITTLGSALLTPPGGANEILLNISRPDLANDNFFASFAYVTGGVVGSSTQFSLSGLGFQGEDFVRARFFASQDLPLAVPEPGTAWLIGLAGLFMLAGMRRAPISKK